MMRRQNSVFTMLVGLAVVVATVACGKSEEKPRTQAQPAAPQASPTPAPPASTTAAPPPAPPAPAPATPDAAPSARLSLWAKYPAPPDNVAKISVIIPHFAPMDDVPLGR